MKKALLLLLAAGLLTACGSEETAKPKEEQKEEVKSDDELSQAEWMEKQEKEGKIKQDEGKEIKVEVTEQVFYRWVDESTGDTDTISVYAEIKNAGDEPANVSQTKVTYLNSAGEVISTMEANAFYTNLMPSVIGPGDVAYLALDIDDGQEFADFKDIQIEVFPFEDEFTKINKLTEDKTKIVKTDDWGGSLSVTGFLQNHLESPTTIVEASAGLYDKDKKFIGAVGLGSTDDIKINANSKTSVDLSVPSFPSTEIQKVDHAKISAISLEMAE